jgi:hypothetical protein
MTTPNVTDITFKPAPDRLGESGLLGWVGFTVGGLVRFEGLTLRRLLNGTLALRYPRTRLVAEDQVASIQPIDWFARRDIELQVFAALSTEVPS